MEWKDRNSRTVNLKWERFEHPWISFHACSLSQPYQSRRKSVFKKYCLKVKDCEIVIDVNKITTNPRKQRANELQNKINVQTYRVLLGFSSKTVRTTVKARIRFVFHSRRKTFVATWKRKCHEHWNACSKATGKAGKLSIHFFPSVIGHETLGPEHNDYLNLKR